jgi:nuclear receptor interaction protein
LLTFYLPFRPASNERNLPRREQFGYDFLKAILLWLDSGVGALIEGFSSPSASFRRPIPPEADMDDIDEILIPYLLQLASDDPVVDVDANRFETADTRHLYSSEKAAVIAFARALKIPFADLTGTVDPTSDDPVDDVQDRDAAKERWAFKIGRGILLNASKGIRFSAVDRAYGGSGISDATVRAEEKAHRQRQEDIDLLEDDEDDDIEDDVVAADPLARHTSTQSEASTGLQPVLERAGSGLHSLISDDIMEEDDEDEEVEEDDENDDSDGDIDPFDTHDDDDDYESVDEEGLSRTRSGHLLWRSDYNRSYQRQRVESEVPCAPHTRVYSGHCNIRTVKDVNFFGQQDEYVVSGSDCGHLFIWDRKTAQLVNILEGDGEIVNVVQGKSHPFESIALNANHNQVIHMNRPWQSQALTAP